MELGIALGTIVVGILLCIWVMRKERKTHQETLDKWEEEVKKGDLDA
jgi:hypothetical protein